MKSIKMKKIVAALGAAVALASVTQVAQADSLLFPVYRVGNGVFSFLSLNSIPGSVGGANNLHYVWNSKPLVGGSFSNTASCSHEDAPGSMTAFDLIQQTVEDPTLSGGNKLNLQTLFGDTSHPAYSLVAPAVGFMTVTNGAGESNLFGQMILIDAANGIVTGYKGLNNPASTAEGDFSSVFTSKTIFNTTWYPTTEAGSTLGAAGVNTSWFVGVTGTGMASPAWNGSGVLANALLSTNVFNRDEGPRSGVKAAPITCFGVVNRADFMTAAQATHTANGGISYQRFGTLAGGATGALMTKIEMTTALGGNKTIVSSENAFPNLPY